ncbi:hypothetical protein BD410DRAFT_843442 [Rickenella mellea]|uniref:Uncharacterized protein n=1 Tax=Rickenella mellea TaxID=50990 RepID=A0A4Y7PSV0_9AGAM|nr:hypothetical protein BD410DRAFT_843442 [Rickenella mellea]
MAVAESLSRRSSCADWVSLVEDEIQAQADDAQSDSDGSDISVDLALQEESGPEGSDSDVPESVGRVLSVSSSPSVEEVPNPNKTSADATHVVDQTTFQQVLQLMVQQASALDRQRTELTRLQKEHRHELAQRDTQVKRADSQMHMYRDECSKAVATANRLESEFSTMKSQWRGKLPSRADMVTLDDHTRILRRSETEWRNRVSNLEAEKGDMVFQISRLQIELAQMRNQVSEYQYPEDVVDALSERLRREVETSCYEVIKQINRAKEMSAEAEIRTAEITKEIEEANEQPRQRLGVKNSPQKMIGCVILTRTLTRILNNAMTSEMNLTIEHSNEVDAAIEQARADYTDLQQEYEKVLSEFDNLKSANIDAEQKLADATSEIDTLKSVINDSETSNPAATERDAFKKALETAEATIEQVGADYGTLQQKHDKGWFPHRVRAEPPNMFLPVLSGFDDLKSANIDTEQKLAEATSEIGKLKAAISDAETSSLAANERDAFKMALEIAETKQTQLKSQVEEFQNALLDARVAREEITKEKDQLQKVLEETQIRLATSMKKNEEDSTTLSELRKEISKMRLENESLSTTCGRLNEIEQQLLETKTNSDNLNIALENSQKEMETVRARNVQVEKEKDEVQSRLEEALEHVTKLTSESSEAEARNNENAKERDALREKLSSAEARVAEVMKNSEEAAKEARNQEARATAEISKLKEGSKTAARLTAELTKELDQAKEDLERVKKDIVTLTAENDENKLGLADAIKSRVEISKELDEVKEQLETVTAESDKLKMDLAGSESLREEIASEINIHKAVGKIKITPNVCLLVAFQDLARAAVRIERMEAARLRMAAIYKTGTPLNSPDRPHASNRNTTPASSPTTSQGGFDFSGPRQKRPRLSRSTTELDVDMNIDPVLRSGSSALTAIPVDDGDDGSFMYADEPSVPDTTPSSQAVSHVASSVQPAVNAPLAVSFPPASPTRQEPSKAEILSFCETFVKLASWFGTDEQQHCGFCECVIVFLRSGPIHEHNTIDRLENSHSPLPVRGPLQFYAISQPDKFWGHCRVMHPSYWKPEFRLSSTSSPADLWSNSSPQSIAAPIVHLLTSLRNLPSGEPDAQKVILRKFAAISTWVGGAGRFLCGLCELENAHSELREQTRSPLDFNPLIEPPMFMAHCRTSHRAFWHPDVQSAVLLVPEELL